MSSPKINLQSSDGEVFTVEVKVARVSGTIKQLLDLWMGENNDEEVIPLLNVSTAILRKVIEWSNHHKDDPEPPPAEGEENRMDDMSSWDAEFLKVDQGTLFELILAANYLDIKGLLSVGCKIVARMMSGKSPEEIRQMFHLGNDLSPEEEKQIRQENEWCEEK